MMTESTRYDRQLLLYGNKRNAVLDLSEVQKYGADSYGNKNYTCIYGLQPAEWYGRGIRLLGRTAVECTRDELASAIGQDIAAVARKLKSATALVIDLFAGSGNTLYWTLRHLPTARGLGCELDPQVYELTARNLQILGLPVRVENWGYRSVLVREAAAKEELVVAFIAPPWGKALDPKTGLNLLATLPPIPEILEQLHHAFSGKRVLCAIQVSEVIEPRSLKEVNSKFDWASLRIYQLNAPGQNHGIILGTKGCAPPSEFVA